MKVALAYVPALHKGYLNFFNTLEKERVEKIYIVGDDILTAHEELDYLNRKDRLRALPTDTVIRAVQTMVDIPVEIADREVLNSLSAKGLEVYVPREDISSFLVKTYVSDAQIHFVDIFLRWHKENVGEDKVPEAVRKVKPDVFQKEVIEKISDAASVSFDWWRQIGGALIKDGKVLFTTHNEHLPEEQLPNIIGDTRALFKKGIHINYVTTAHVEIALIAEAARRGIVTENAELYVTDFPCPYCARAIAKSGIKTLYFLKGYAVLDGDDFLKDAGVEVIHLLATEKNY